MWLCSGKGERLGYKRFGFDPTVTIFFLLIETFFNNKSKWQRTFTERKFAKKFAMSPQDAAKTQIRIADI